MSTITSRISPLHWPAPPGAARTVERVVVGSPTLHETSLQPADVSVMHCLPDRLNGNLDYDTLDVFPVLPVTPRADGYAPRVSSVLVPESLVGQTPGSLFDDTARPYSSILGSPVTSLSITGRAEDLRLPRQWPPVIDHG